MITLKERTDYWVAIHEGTGVGTQAPTRAAALDEAVALHANDTTEPVEDEDALLRELGIDPEDQPTPRLTLSTRLVSQ